MGGASEQFRVRCQGEAEAGSHLSDLPRNKSGPVAVGALYERPRGRRPRLQGLPLLDHSAVGKHAVLRHDHDSVADVIARSIEMMDSLLVQDSNINSDVRVFVDDRIADRGAAADSDVRNS